MKIAVLGSGNGGCAVAFDWATRGHQVSLFDFAQFAESIESIHATRIVIAHRLSTILGADRIYVMDGGRVVQSGTFQELSGQEGLFAELVARQEL